jgi:hypothetical protein
LAEYLNSGWERTWIAAAPPKLLPKTNKGNLSFWAIYIAFLKMAIASIKICASFGFEFPSLSENPLYAINKMLDFELLRKESRKYRRPPISWLVKYYFPHFNENKQLFVRDLDALRTILWVSNFLMILSQYPQIIDLFRWDDDPLQDFDGCDVPLSLFKHR